MSEHLPECNCTCSDWCGSLTVCTYCICDKLRACEQRVREEFPAALSATSVQSMSIYGQGLREGFLSALDAAEAAVEAIHAPYKEPGDPVTYGPYAEGKADMQDLAVAAIAALKEKP